MTWTWYIVQTERGYVRGAAPSGWQDCERDARKAARMCLEKARQVFRLFAGMRDARRAQSSQLSRTSGTSGSKEGGNKSDGRASRCARRFPRIIKVTLNTKTIKEG